MIWLVNDDRHNYQASKNNVAFSRWRILVLEKLEKDLGSENGRSFFHTIDLKTLGLYYDSNVSVADFVTMFTGNDELDDKTPKATVIRTQD